MWGVSGYRLVQPYGVLGIPCPALRCLAGLGATNGGRTWSVSFASWPPVNPRWRSLARTTAASRRSAQGRKMNGLS